MAEVSTSERPSQSREAESTTKQPKATDWNGLIVGGRKYKPAILLAVLLDILLLALLTGVLVVQTTCESGLPSGASSSPGMLTVCTYSASVGGLERILTGFSNGSVHP